MMVTVLRTTEPQADAAPENAREIERDRRHRPIDLVHLAKQTLGDPGLEQEILRMYAQISKGYYDKLEGCTDLDEIKHCLHSLKGSSAGVGAVRVQQAALRAEEMFREDGELSQEMLKDLGFYVVEAGKYIADLLVDDILDDEDELVAM